MEDFSGQLLTEAEAQKYSRPSYISPYGVARQGEWADGINGVSYFCMVPCEILISFCVLLTLYRLDAVMTFILLS